MRMAISSVVLLLGIAASSFGSAQEFIRGDVNGDGRISLVDAGLLTEAVMGSQEDPPCWKAADANGDAYVDLGDSVAVLGFLFLASQAPPAPYPACGVEPGISSALTCIVPPSCSGPAPAPPGPFTIFVSGDPDAQEPPGQISIFDLVGTTFSRPIFVHLKGRLEDGGGPTGWSFGVVLEGGSLSEISVRGTDVDALPQHEVEVAYDTPEGFVSAVLLEFSSAEGVSLNGAQKAAPTIVRATVGGTIRGDGTDFIRIRPVGLLDGRSRPVEAEVLVGSEAFQPDLVGLTIAVHHGDPFGFFIRADANADLKHDIADVVFTLAFLFQGGDEPYCIDSLDANDDGAVDISDALSSLGCLFLGTSCPPPPFPECRADPTDDFMDCDGIGCF